MSDSPRCCILISSHPAAMRLARWTAAQLRSKWSDHPPLYFSGSAVRHSDADLVLRADPKDWMAVTADAVSDLGDLGYSHVYLILDDHPPFGECNARYLNFDLPAAAGRLKAAMISLLGYGQHRPLVGDALGKDDLLLELTPASYRWKFSLHPGLWSLSGLKRLLERRRAQYPHQPTPWNFERHIDESDIYERVGGGAYRICGTPYDVQPDKPFGEMVQIARHMLYDAALLGTRLLAGTNVRTQKAADWHWAYCFYRGPYPIFWSGVAMQGRPNPHLVKALRVSDVGRMRGVIAEAWKLLND